MKVLNCSIYDDGIEIEGKSYVVSVSPVDQLLADDYYEPLRKILGGLRLVDRSSSPEAYARAKDTLKKWANFNTSISE